MKICYVNNSVKTNQSYFWALPGYAPDRQYLAPENVHIEVKPHLRDLGVEISSDLTFKVHIYKMVTAATRLSHSVEMPYLTQVGLL